MRIIIIGGHGKVALLAAPQLATGGHEVVSVIRNPDQMGDIEEANATALVADVETLGVEGIRDLVRGFDAILWAAGAGGGSKQRTYAVDRDAAGFSCGWSWARFCCFDARV